MFALNGISNQTMFLNRETKEKSGTVVVMRRFGLQLFELCTVHRIFHVIRLPDVFNLPSEDKAIRQNSCRSPDNHPHLH